MIISLVQDVGVACSCPCTYSECCIVGITNGLLVQYAFAVSSIGRLVFFICKQIIWYKYISCLFFYLKKTRINFWEFSGVVGHSHITVLSGQHSYVIGCCSWSEGIVCTWSAPDQK